MSFTSTKLASAAALGLAATAFAAASLPAQAGAPFSEYSCHELWMERNGVLANNGYCFKSAKAIAEFGKGCHPPYGDLSSKEEAIVSEIKMWEKKKGCN